VSAAASAVYLRNIYTSSKKNESKERTNMHVKDQVSCPQKSTPKIMTSYI
jgi:hypothetical protein